MKKSYLIILFCSTLAATIIGAENPKKPVVTEKRQRCCPNGECIKKEQTPKSTNRNLPATNKSKAQSIASIDRLSQAAQG